MEPQVFIFIGRAGCGKGTQADLLVSYLKEKSERAVLYIEMGKSLRSFTETETSHTSKLARELMGKGALLPAFIPVWVWSSILVEQFTGQEHLVFEGAPRKVQDAVMIDSAFEFYNVSRPHIIYLNVSNEWSRERLMGRKRGDDSFNEIEKRLAWFETDVVPVIEYYKAKHNPDVHTIDGEQTIEAVHADIVAAIESQ